MRYLGTLANDINWFRLHLPEQSPTEEHFQHCLSLIDFTLQSFFNRPDKALEIKVVSLVRKLVRNNFVLPFLHLCESKEIGILEIDSLEWASLLEDVNQSIFQTLERSERSNGYRDAIYCRHFLKFQDFEKNQLSDDLIIAANLEQSHAMFELAECCFEGGNLEEGIDWMVRAMKIGHRLAAMRLVELASNKEIDSLVAKTHATKAARYLAAIGDNLGMLDLALLSDEFGYLMPIAACSGNAQALHLLCHQTPWSKNPELCAISNVVGDAFRLMDPAQNRLKQIAATEVIDTFLSNWK